MYFDESDARKEIELLKRESKSVVWGVHQQHNFIIPPTVYPPREDTTLLAKEIIKLGPGKGRKALEIGSGSGALSLVMSQLGWKVEACDINPYAVMSTNHNLKNAGFDTTCREGGPGPDGIQWAANAPYDLIVWNIPYLTSEDNADHLGPLEEAALSTNRDINLMEILIQQIKQHHLLSRNGLLLMLHQNKHALFDFACGHGMASRRCSNQIFEDGEEIQVTCFWNPWHNSPIQHVEIVDSTNKSLLETQQQFGTHMTAKTQTKGRGRYERTWLSPIGSYSGSWILNPKLPISPGLIQIFAGMCVIRCLKTFGISNLYQKWPNDIFTDEGKIGGILVESQSIGNQLKIVLGIGLNLSTHISLSEEGYPHLDRKNPIEFHKFDEEIHAYLASIFECREELSKPDFELLGKEAYQLICAFGTPFYRNKEWLITNLTTDGFLELSSENESLIVNEGETLNWSRK